jgi:hypothetical protein
MGINRKTVMIGTMVAMFALSTGFVAASLTTGGGITTYNGFTGGTTTATYGTVFQTSAIPAVVANGGGYSPACLANNAAAPTLSASQQVYVSATGITGVCGSTDNTLNFVFNYDAFTCPASGSDTFTVTTTGSLGAQTTTFTLACTQGAVGASSLTVGIDFGATAIVYSASIAITATATAGY